MKDTDPQGDVVHENGIVVGSMTVTEVTGLINLFNAQLLAMEGRLVLKMDDNSRAATERWAKHDQDLATNTQRVVSRFEALEGSILVIEKALEAHLDKEHDEEVAIQARVKPVKMSLKYIEQHWRTLALWIVMLLTLFGVTVGRLSDFGILR